MTFLLGVFISLSILFAGHVQADLAEPVRKLDRRAILMAQPEAVRKIESARVVVADYGLLIRDFPQVARIARISAEKKVDPSPFIDRWILENSGYLAEAQVHAQSGVNTDIQRAAGPEAKTAHRPFAYGRGLVFKVPGGLIDGKGFGSLSSAQKHHKNGLATTGECIREFLFEKLVNNVLKDAQSKHRTVGNYAVIDWGFDIIHADGSKSPAGAVLRQAHTRALTAHTGANFNFLGYRAAQEVESVLRRYGITAAGDARAPTVEKVNLQGTRDNHLVDFGAFLVLDRFEEKPAVTYSFIAPEPARPMTSHEARFAAQTLLHPEMPGFPQPDPARRVSFSIWGNDGVADPKFDRIWMRAHEMANRFRQGHKAEVRGEVLGLIEEVKASLGKAPGAGTPVAPVRYEPSDIVRAMVESGRTTRLDAAKAIPLLEPSPSARNLKWIAGLFEDRDIAVRAAAYQSLQGFLPQDVQKKLFRHDPKALKRILEKASTVTDPRTAGFMSKCLQGVLAQLESSSRPARK